MKFLWKTLKQGHFDLFYEVMRKKKKKKVAERFIETSPYLKQFLIFINPEKNPKFNFTLGLHSACLVYSHIGIYQILLNWKPLNFVFAFLDHYGTFLKSIHAFT